MSGFLGSRIRWHSLANNREHNIAKARLDRLGGLLEMPRTHVPWRNDGCCSLLLRENYEGGQCDTK